MSTLVSCHGIAKILAHRTLFEGLGLHIHPKDRIGLIGANGSGKTSLLSMALRCQALFGTVTTRTGADASWSNRQRLASPVLRQRTVKKVASPARACSYGQQLGSSTWRQSIPFGSART